jgi:hypothetical protein
MDMKPKDLENIGKTVGLKLSVKRLKSLGINVECKKKFQIRGENVVEVKKFIYLDSKTEVDVKTHPESKFSLYTVV